MKRFCDLKVGNKFYIKDDNIKELEIEKVEFNYENGKICFKQNENSIYKFLYITNYYYEKEFAVYPSDRFNHISFSTSMDRLLLEVSE